MLKNAVFDQLTETHETYLKYTENIVIKWLMLLITLK